MRVLKHVVVILCSVDSDFLFYDEVTCMYCLYFQLFKEQYCFDQCLVDVYHSLLILPV
jgi:hypothetical protein